MTTKRRVMDQIPLYPLRFEPIYQYRLWGGRRLANLLSAPLPGDGPIGEAWLLSDREDHPSRVADGPLKGQSIGQLLHQWPEQLLGKLAGRFRRFPLLLKFLDARDVLSVQVHPSDRQTKYLPAGETGKTEAESSSPSKPAQRKVRLNDRPHPGPLLRGEGESFTVPLKICVPGFAGWSADKPDTCPCCSFSLGEKVRMRAG